MVARLRLFAVAAGAIALAGCSATPAGEQTTSSPTSTSVPAHHRQARLVDLAARPAGWVDVEWQRLQLSVPASWGVVVTPACQFTPAGTLTLGGGTGYCPANIPANRSLLGSAVVVDDVRLPPSEPPNRPRHLDGLTVFEEGPDELVVPALGVSLTYRGALGRRVAETLTRSPRTVALGIDGTPVPPATWRQIGFAGLEVSVPASWPQSDTSAATSGGYPCSLQSDLAPPEPAVTLSSATHWQVAYRCPALGGSEKVLPSALGLVVDAAGPAAAGLLDGTGHASCWNQRGLRLCARSLPDQSILLLSAEPLVRPGRYPVVVAVGLAGSGLVDREIVDSLGVGSAH